MAKRMKISKGGQVSIPASVRKRWGTSTVLIEDHEDGLFIRPASDDPIEGAKGSLAHLAEGAESPEGLVRELRDQDVKAG